MARVRVCPLCHTTLVDGAWLVQELVKRGVKQVEIAKQVGVSEVAVSHWVHGVKQVAGRHVRALAALLTARSPTWPVL